MNKFFLIVLLAFVMTGCQSYKKVPYLQDAEAVSHGVQNEQLYDAKIMPKDLLTIVVSCTSPELAAPFNLTVATQNNAALNYTTSQPVLQQYLVDNDGNINFPVLGELHVGGLTKKATEQMIVEKLMQGPESGAYPTINPNANLLGVTIKDDICYVNFDSTFLNGEYDILPKLTIYSIVNSLVEGTEATQVQITINGESKAKYMGTVDLSQPLKENLELVAADDKK